MSDEFLEIAMEVCGACNSASFAICKKHDVCMCLRDGSTMHCPIADCSAKTPAALRSCSVCGSSQQTEIINVTKAELEYGRDGVSEGDTIDHTVMCCSSCRAVGFPGSRKELTVRISDCNFYLQSASRRMEARNWTLAHLPSCSASGREILEIATKVTKATFLSGIAVFDASVQALAARETMLRKQRSAKRRTAPALNLSAGIKPVALKFFSRLVGSMDFSNPDVYKAALEKVTAVLATAAADGPSLFADWSPPREPPTESAAIAVDAEAPADGGFKSPSATNTASSHGPELALESKSGYWATTGTPGPSTWSARLESAATPIHQVHIKWETSGTNHYVPASFTLQFSDDGKTWTEVAKVEDKDPKTEAVVECDGAVASFIQVAMSGYPSKNSNATFGISGIDVRRKSGDGIHLSVRNSLADLSRWILGVVGDCPDAAVRDQALVGLESLSLASGSLELMLRLADGLLASPDRPLPADTELGKASAGFVDSIRAAAWEERQAQAKLELQAGPGAGGGGGGAFGEVDAEFELDAENTSRVTLSEGNKVAHSNAGSHSVVFLNQGPFTSGKASWTIQLVEDTNSQCTCFGAAIKPVTDCNYERSSQLWMYRAYNGYRYSLGRCNSSGSNTKIRKGDIVRCELDMDAGTMHVFINDADQGPCFTNLSGYEVWPAIQFYSSGRRVRLIKFEGPTGGAAVTTAETANLCDLSEQDVSVGYGSFGKAGDMGYGEGSDRKIKVDGVSAAAGISMHPPKNEDPVPEGQDPPAATATYVLNKKYSELTGSVGLNDSASAEKFAEDGSPVTFEVYTDGRLAWQSDPVSAVKTAVPFTVNLLAVDSLTLKVRVAGGNTFAHAVWMDPTLVVCADWSCDGWRNPKDAFTCALTGTKRGEVSPLPAVSAAPTSTHGLAQAALAYVGLLSNEYLRGMRDTAEPTSNGFATVDLEAPLAIEVSQAGLSMLARLLTKAMQDKSAPVLVALLRLVRANLRRLIVSRVDPVEAGVISRDSGSGSGAAAGAGGASESKTGDEADPARDLHAALKAIYAIEGLPAEVYATASEAEATGLRLFLPSRGDRQTWFQSQLPAGGTVEMQLNFPCDPVVGDKVVSFDTMLLMLQLHCQSKGWNSVLLGRWPAKVYFVVEVPAATGLLQFLQRDLGDVLKQAEFLTWSFPDGLATPELPLKVERTGQWDRRSRLPLEPGAGTVRAYPSSVAGFDDVVKGIKDFLPK